MSIFASIFLKEHIGYKRWLSIFLGFVGVYIILNPNFNDFDYKTLLPLLCALFYSLSMTITKITSDKDDTYTQLFYFYLITILLCSFLFLILGFFLLTSSSHLFSSCSPLLPIFLHSSSIS